MNQTNVLVPDATADEALVVDRFIEASRDLVPSVQISLAKRIVSADSKQVMCLAAHTSVPLHPSDASSVSDLALKLSDGTNVRLSLKFFNDALSSAGGEYIPLTRNLYDPNRYEVKNRSRFPASPGTHFVDRRAGQLSVLHSRRKLTNASPPQGSYSNGCPPPVGRCDSESGNKFKFKWHLEFCNATLENCVARCDN